MSSTDILNNVQKKLDNNKANDIVKNIETPPTTPIKMNVPDNPFMSGDGDDGIERDELTAKQNMMFQNYLKRKGYKNFGDWWKKEGNEEVEDIYSEALINSGKDLSEKKYWKNETNGILRWWDNYLSDNLYSIINKLRFIRVWGDSFK
jgi:hypothetical protein